jgi:tetratricopeptide (TPR) repeat protein
MLKSGGADGLYSLGRIKEAKNTYRAIAKADPNNAKACLKYANLLYDSFEYHELDSFISELSPRLKSLSLSRKLQLLKNKAQRELARDGLASSDRTRLAERLLKSRRKASNAYNQAHYPEAFEEYKKIEQKLPLRAEECLNYARCAHKLKKTEIASTLTKIAETRGAEHSATLRLLSDIAVQNKDFDQAEAFLNEALATNSRLNFDEKLGHINFRKGDVESCIAHYKKFFSRPSDSRKYQNHRFQYASALKFNAQFDEAKEIFDKLTIPECALSPLALELVQEQDPAKTIRKFKKSCFEEENINLTATPLVTCIVATMRPELLKQVLDTFRSQTYENKKLFLIFNRADFTQTESYDDAMSDNAISVFEAGDSLYHGGLLNLGISHADEGLIAVMDDDDEYGPLYLERSIKFLQRHNYKVVGKGSYFLHFKESDELYLSMPRNKIGTSATHCAGSSIISEANYMQEIGFSNLFAGADTLFLQKVHEKGDSVGACDPFGYIYNRFEKPGSHTWDVSSSSLKLSSFPVGNSSLRELILNRFPY